MANDADFPSILQQYHVVFIRKLPRASYWKDADKFLTVFLDEDCLTSLYLISNSEELKRAVAALSGGRQGSAETIDCIWCTPAELALFAIGCQQNDDAAAIACLAARRLHHDASIQACDSANLVNHLKSQNRESLRLRPKYVQAVRDELQPQGCKAYSENKEANVTCRSCTPAPSARTIPL